MDTGAFIYGVFVSRDDLFNAVESMREKGIKNISIVRDSAVSFQSATVGDCLSRWFKIFGGAGALIGGLSGIAASPTVPAGGYQFLTPLMAAVSGAVICAYFGVWIYGFLHGVDKPLIQTDMFTGKIENGAFLVAVQVNSNEHKLAVFNAMESCGAVELIVRSLKVGTLLPVNTVSAGVVENVPKPVALVA